MFAWQRQERTDLLVMACEGVGDEVEAAALVAEPNDEKTLRLRAGPDAETLKGRSAVLFGAGALGGHVAVALAESGVDSLRIVDSDLLSPGNVVRHVAGHDHVGGPKVNAVEAAITNHAPWTKVESITPPTNPYGSQEIAQLVENADVVIDATGNDSFVHPVALVAEGLGKPLVSGALFRGGFIGRVQRKALDTDAPITARPDSFRYPGYSGRRTRGRPCGARPRLLRAREQRAACLRSRLRVTDCSSRHRRPDGTVRPRGRGD